MYISSSKAGLFLLSNLIYPLLSFNRFEKTENLEQTIGFIWTTNGLLFLTGLSNLHTH